MAIKLPSVAEKIKVISRHDSSVDGVSQEVYEEYLKSLDESLLSFVPGEEPTRFVMRLSLPYDMKMKVQDSQVSIKGGDVEVRASYVLEEVRFSLIAIENPPNLPTESMIKFDKHSDGGACKSLMQSLDAAGIVMDLFLAKQNAISNVTASMKKK